MAYPSLAPTRRDFDSRRRRRRIVLLVILAAAVGLITLAVRYRTEERRTVDYLAVAAEVAQDQQATAESLSQTLADLGGTERQDLISRIESLGADVAASRVLLEAQTVPASAIEAHGFLTVAVQSWEAALGSLDDAVLSILDSEDDDATGEAMLAASFEWLRVGDQAFEGFLAARARMEGEPDPVSLVSVDFVPEGREALYDSESIATRLRSTRNLEGRHDISIAARTVPEPLGTSSGRPVVPASEVFSVLVVITNEGNLVETEIPVNLRLAVSGSDGEPVKRSQLILSIDPGESTTIEFAEFDLVPGELYDLQITASIIEDADPLNNVFDMTFFRNQES